MSERTVGDRVTVGATDGPFVRGVREERRLEATVDRVDRTRFRVVWSEYSSTQHVVWFHATGRAVQSAHREYRVLDEARPPDSA